MDVIGGIITAGVAVIAIAIITNVAGTTLLNVPTFSATASVQSANWMAVMNNVSANSISGFSLLSISFLVIAAALIISILLGVFIFRR